MIAGIGVGVASIPRLGSMIGPNVGPGGRLSGGSIDPITSSLGTSDGEPVGEAAPFGWNA